MTERLKLLPKQLAYFLLKNCLGIPKLLYTLRTVPTFLCQDKLCDMDSILHLSLKAILNLNLSDLQWKQASLPVKQGGIGIRSFSDLSLPTFLSSCSGVMPLVSTILNKPVDNVVLNSWTQGVQMWEMKYQEMPEEKTQQRQWDAIILKLKIEQEVVFEDPVDVARMKALQNKESGAWLNVYPSKNIGTLLNDQSFQICIGQRLGCNICRKFTCKCGRTVDEKGLHPLSCEKSSGRYFRHAEVNNILKRALGSIDIPAQLEPTGLDRNDGKRPDGATIVPWRMGQSLVWDFTCADTLAPSYINKTCRNAGAAAEIAVQKKHTKYSAIKSRGIGFVVMAVETMGVWCKEGKDWIREIGKRLIEKTGDPRSMNHLREKISLTIQRGNAASVLAVLPSEELGSMFYL
uniref:Uncharacterized protein n=2 Tax=Cacopsylla melanoneura TaxID=428564 RepID=A0A8D8ZUA8_9HEMI